MRRTFYEDDHETYRATVRTFLAREVRPHIERWEAERLIGRDLAH
jgi:long-chain-acyl-CoA dehydrogenase